MSAAQWLALAVAAMLVLAANGIAAKASLRRERERLKSHYMKCADTAILRALICFYRKDMGGFDAALNVAVRYIELSNDPDDGGKR